MKQRFIPGALLIAALTIGSAHAYDGDQAKLVGALKQSKLTLADGIRQAAKNGAAVISAKFEFDDAGKLSLSVYSAQRGAAMAPESNVLQELSGSPEQAAWAPQVEVFKDVEHVARSSEQLTLLALSRVTLLDLVGRIEPARDGVVFSVMPHVRQHRPVAVALVAKDGKVTELTYSLADGKLLERHPL